MTTEVGGSARPDFSKYGALILVGGTVFWGVSEIMQIFSGGLTIESLVIGGVGLLDMGIGIWGVWIATRNSTGSSALLGTGTLALGFLLLAVVRIITAIDQTHTTLPTSYVPAAPIFFGLAALVALIGALIFSGSIIRTTPAIPRWTGAVLIIGMLVALMGAAADIPYVIPRIINIATAAALAIVAVRVLRGS